MVNLPSGDLALTPALSWLSFPTLSLSFPICIMVTRRAARREGSANCNVLSCARTRSPPERRRREARCSATPIA